jgi:sulfur relay (sulfurtransferase) DsrC/TusE family protein
MTGMKGLPRHWSVGKGIGELAADRIETLRFIMEYYKKFNYFPIITSVCKHIHKPKDCMQEELVNPLLAWKLAGLPQPEEPIISLLEAGQTPG